MEISHRCTAFAYYESCIIVNYLNVCVKALENFSISDLGGKILVSFQYRKDKLGHRHYVGHPLPPSPRKIILTGNTMRAAAARRVQESALGPVNGGANGGSNMCV